MMGIYSYFSLLRFIFLQEIFTSTSMDSPLLLQKMLCIDSSNTIAKYVVLFYPPGVGFMYKGTEQLQGITH